MGYSNNVSGPQSGGLGFNNTVSCGCSYVMGIGIVTNRGCTTFVNNLSIMNIPTVAPAESGAVWRNGTVLEIVP